MFAQPAQGAGDLALPDIPFSWIKRMELAHPLSQKESDDGENTLVLGKRNDPRVRAIRLVRVFYGCGTWRWYRGYSSRCRKRGGERHHGRSQFQRRIERDWWGSQRRNYELRWNHFIGRDYV